MQDKITHIVTSEQMADQCTRDIVQMIKEFGWCNVEIKAGGRTIPQNKTYWMWLQEACDYLNDKAKGQFSLDDMHDRMRHEFLGYDADKTIGTTVITGQLRSTTKLTKGEMFHYMSQVEAFWADRGLLVTIPGDSQYAKLKREHEIGH